VIPYYITREFITDHPEWTFVHSTDFWDNQKVGPALVCQGLSNCYGVPVRWRLCKSSGYFSDNAEEQIKQKIDEMIGRIPLSRPVILFPKIGSGHSMMYKFAPRCFAYLQQRLKAIATPIARDYTNV